MSTLGRRPFFGHALLCILVGALADPRILAWLFSPDGAIETGRKTAVIRVFQALAVLSGLLLLMYGPRIREPGAVRRIRRAALVALYSLAAATFVIFCALEAVPRLARPLGLTWIRRYALWSTYAPDDRLVFRMRPGSWSSSTYVGDLYSPAFGVPPPPIACSATYGANGFRAVRAPAQADIVVLGDSYIEFGADDADTFAERLRAASGRATAGLGLAWYGPHQYVILLRDHGVGLKPKIALMCFFEGNDAGDAGQYAEWARGGRYYDFTPNREPLLRRYGLTLREVASHLARRLRAGPARTASTAERRDAERPGATSAPPAAAAAAAPPAPVHPGLVCLHLGDRRVHAAFGYANDPRPPEELLHTKEWAAAQDALAQFGEVCRRHGIEPVVLFLPTTIHIYAEHIGEGTGATWLARKEEQVAAKGNVENALARLCRDLDLRMLTLTPLFERLAREGHLLYYPFDSHWNSEAREAAAQYVAAALRDQAPRNSNR